MSVPLELIFELRREHGCSPLKCADGDTAQYPAHDYGNPSVAVGTADFATAEKSRT